MKVPRQSPPVKRPDLIHPYATVDVVHGSVEELVGIRLHLLHGANYNDPAAFQYRSYQQLRTAGDCGSVHALAGTAFL